MSFPLSILYFGFKFDLFFLITQEKRKENEKQYKKKPFIYVYSLKIATFAIHIIIVF